MAAPTISEKSDSRDSISGFNSLLNKRLLLFLPWLLLFATPIFSFLIYSRSRSAIEISIASIFDRSSNEVNSGLIDRIDFYTESFRGIQALFASSEKVTSSEWQTFIDKLDILERFRGITSVSYVQKVDDVDGYVRDVLSDPRLVNEDMSHFQIYPTDTSSSNIYAVRYLEPLLELKNLIGFDIASDPARLKALEESRDTGRQVMTSPIKSPLTDSLSFEILLPIYRGHATPETVEQRRSAITGFIVASFDVKEFFNSVYGSTLLDSQLKISIYDNSRQGDYASYLLFSNIDEESTSFMRPTVSSRTITFTPSANNWIIKYDLLQDETISELINIPVLRFWFTSFLGLLTFIIIYLVINQGRRSESMASHLADELRKQKNILDLILSSTPDRIILFGEGLKYEYLNKEASKAYNKLPESVYNRTWNEVKIPVPDSIFADNIREVFKTGKSIVDDLSGENDSKSFEYILSPVRSSEFKINYVLCTIREVTKYITREKSMEKKSRDLEEINAQLLRRERRIEELKQKLEEGEKPKPDSAGATTDQG